MKPNAILFVDIDDAEITRYTYREPHFAAAKEMGLLCLTAALQGRQYTERLSADSDEVFYVESMTLDALRDLVHDLLDTYNLRTILCHAGHASASGQVGCIVAEICQEMELPHASSNAIAACNNKFLMRQILKKHDIRSVRYALCSNEEELSSQANMIGYPLIAKPPFGACSVFIKKCNNWAELQVHYQTFTAHYEHSNYTDFMGNQQEYVTPKGEKYVSIPGKSLLLEEYIDGIEGTIECAINQNTIYPVLINEKLILTEKSNTVLENLLIAPPVSFSPSEQEQIKNYAIACLSAVGLNNAIVHLEFRMTSEGPVVIEINPRLGGLFVNSAFRDLAGLNPYQLYLSILIQDQEVDFQLTQACKQAEQATQHYSMIVMYPDTNGYFKGIENLNYLKNQPCILECVSYTNDCYINAEIEEHYLIKCWAKVEGASHAHTLHNNMLENVKPIIIPESDLIS